MHSIRIARLDHVLVVQEKGSKKRFHTLTHTSTDARSCRSSCADVDLYFGSMTVDTSEVDLGQTTKLECPKDEDTEIVIVSGQQLTVKSALDYQEPVK